MLSSRLTRLHRDQFFCSLRGRHQAQRLGERLKGVEFEAIYTSDLLRATETTQILLANGVKVIGGPIFSNYSFSDHPYAVLDDLLREKGAGALEGKPLGTCERMAKSEGVSVRKFRPKNGESWEDVADRTRSFVTNIISNHSTNSTGSKLARPGKPAPTTRTAAVREASAAKRTLSSPLIPATDSRGMERSRSDSSNESIASTASTASGSSRRERPHSAPTKPTGGCGECPGRLDQRARRILVVTHGGTIREMINSHIPAASAKNSAPNCSLTIIRIVPCQPPSLPTVEAIATSFYSTISCHSSADMSRTRSSRSMSSIKFKDEPGGRDEVQYVLVASGEASHLRADGNMLHDECNEEAGEDA